MILILANKKNREIQVEQQKVNFNCHAEEHNIKQLLQNTKRILQLVTVKNPYAEQLKIPAEVFKLRRTNAHCLQFLEVVTVYHQYQREQKTDKATGEGYIETTPEDIAEANKLMKEVLLRKADELSGVCRITSSNSNSIYRIIKSARLRIMKYAGVTAIHEHNKALSYGATRLQLVALPVRRIYLCKITVICDPTYSLIIE